MRARQTNLARTRNTLLYLAHDARALAVHYARKRTSLIGALGNLERASERNARTHALFESHANTKPLSYRRHANHAALVIGRDLSS